MKPIILDLLSFSEVLKRETLQTFICTLGRERKGERRKNSVARPKEKPMERNAKIEQRDFKS